MTSTATVFAQRRRLYVPYWRRAFARLAACLAVARERRELLDLDPRALRDIGIDRLDAIQEARRSFWDLPDASSTPWSR